MDAGRQEETELVERRRQRKWLDEVQALEGRQRCAATGEVTVMNVICNTPGVRLAFWTLASHEPKHHLFIYEHGTYVMH
jgi:ribosomal protein L32